MLERRPRALYAAFDRFPSRKGAAIHIDRFARALFDELGSGCLFVLGSPDLPAHQVEGNVDIVRFNDVVDNFLERAIAFGARLARLLDDIAPSLEVAQFRDPWSGAPIALRPRRSYATIYEVNALPSIELPSLFPAVGASTLEKIREIELACLRASDVVITPSNTTADFLHRLGIANVEVIPNGADIDAPQPRPIDAPDDYLLYFGSPQPWQGIDTLLRAFARLADFESLRLVLCGSRESRSWKPYDKLAAKLGVEERIVRKFALDDRELAAWRQHAYLSVAPLTSCDRNVVQGCAPLKIVESMASGVAVVASDVPPVRELIAHRQNGWLVHPGRPAELARALRILLEEPELVRRMGAAARRTIEQRFTWEQSTAALRRVVKEVYAQAAVER